MNEVVSENWPPPEISIFCHSCHKDMNMKTYFFGPAIWICSECSKKEMEKYNEQK